MRQLKDYAKDFLFLISVIGLFWIVAWVYSVPS